MDTGMFLDMETTNQKETPQFNSSCSLSLPIDYSDWLTSPKQRLLGAHQRALLAAHDEQIRLYHDICREIQSRQSEQGWDAKIICHLATDLCAAFPDMKKHHYWAFDHLLRQKILLSLVHTALE